MWKKRAVIGCVITAGLMMLIGHQTQEASLIMEQPQIKRVEVKGEVIHPGIYELAWEASVEEALYAAGGVSEQGDLSGINQGRSALHQEVIVVPKKQEVRCISINAATKEELDRLPGVGEKMAERIIVERNQAPFLELQDLKRVKGIGDKTYEN